MSQSTDSPLRPEATHGPSAPAVRPAPAGRTGPAVLTLGGFLLSECAWLAAQAAAQTSTAATSTITIVKREGQEQGLSPLWLALIQFGIGTLIIAALVFMVNMILMKGLRLNPLTSSRFAMISGLLLIYLLFAVLFTSVLVGAGQAIMYLVLGVLAVATVFAIVTRK